MNRRLTFAATAVGLALGATSTASWTLMSGVVFAQPSVQVPKFQYDPTFPQPLPEKWAIGAIGGMAVDSHDHIWVLHRPSPLQKNERFAGAAMTPPRADCCIPAPPVLEFDQDGKLLASWGGPGEGYDWPSTEHGIVVDAKDNVWLGGNGEKDDQVLKFTTQGKFLALRMKHLCGQGAYITPAGIGINTPVSKVLAIVASSELTVGSRFSFASPFKSRLTERFTRTTIGVLSRNGADILEHWNVNRLFNPVIPVQWRNRFRNATDFEVGIIFGLAIFHFEGLLKS